MQVSGTALATTVTDGSISLNGGDLLFAADGGGNGFQFDYYNTKMYIGNNAGSTWYMGIQDDGNVGIGTTSPSVKLTVSGDVTDSDVGQFRAVGSTSAAKMINVGYHTTNNYGFISALIAGTGYSALSLQPNGGNVGIGTTSPTAKFQVGTHSIGDAGNGDNSANVRIGAASAGSRVYGMTLANTATATLSNESALSFIVAGNYSATGIISAVLRNTGNAATDLIFTNYSGGLQERMRILYDGNVGIGTSSPKQKLDVSGAGGKIAITNTGTTDYSELVFYEGNSVKADIWVNGSAQATYAGVNSMNIWQGSNAPIAFYTNGTNEKMRIAADGNVGIGTTSPTTKLAVSNGTTIAQVNPYDGVAYFGTVNSYPMALSVNSSEKVRITNDGNVGIGTTIPLYKLDVNGSVNANNIRTTTQIGGTTGTIQSLVTPGIYSNGSSTGNAIAISSNTTFANQGAWANLGLHQTTANANDLTAKVYLAIGGWYQNSGTGLPVYIGGGYTSNSSSVLSVVPSDTAGNGNVGIGTTSPTQRLHVLMTGGSTTAPNIVATFQANTATTILAGGGTAIKFVGVSSGGNLQNYDQGMISTLGYADNNRHGMQFWVKPNASTVLTVGQTIDSNGNLGIGTTSPAAKLHIEGNDIRLNTEGSYAEKSLYFRYSDNAKIMSDSYLTFLTSGTPAERMRITSVGNVGIGTTTVRGLLHVSGDIIRDTNLPYSWGTSAPHRTFAGAYSYANGGVNGVARYLLLWPQITNVNGQNGRFVNARLVVSRGATHAYNDTTIGDVVASAGYNSSANVYAYTPIVGEKLYFYNIVYNSVTYLAISLPISDYRWELTGHYGIEEIAYYSPTFVYANTSGVGTITQLTDYTNESLAIYNKGGNIGIGTTSPFGTAANRTVLSVNGTTDVSLNIGSGGSQRAYLYGVSSYAELGTIGSLPLTFAPNNSEKMRLTSDGNLGIGTTSPSQKLDVNGTIKATSYIGDFTGRLVRTSTTQTITGNSALTIDVAAAYIHVITVAASGGIFGISSVTYNNRKANPEVDEIILIFKWPASGSGSINISNTIGDIPFNYGKATVTRLTSYKGTSGFWIAETVASNIDYTNL